MSLSFVSKTIQTSRADGGYDEKPVEGSEGGQSSYKESHKPLFEQLRANKEQEEAERAEQQIAMMRGTLALDDEDCAHLESLRKQKLQEEAERQQEAAEEIAAFRAAQADRLGNQSSSEDMEPLKSLHSKRQVETANKRDAQSNNKLPKIIVKRRRRDTEEAETKQNESVKQEVEDASKDQTSGIGGLLSGYGSSSDEDDK